MQLLQDTNPHDSPVLKEILNDIQIKEAECFQRVYKRFCWLHGLTFDLAKIDWQVLPNKPNLINYFYVGDVPKTKLKQHFLMSRDLVMVEGQELPVLEIKFNPALLDEKEIN